MKLSYSHTRLEIFPSNSNQPYRVRPKNLVGWSSVYGYLNVTADTEPISMSTIEIVSVDPNVIVISWPDLTNDALVGRD